MLSSQRLPVQGYMVVRRDQPANDKKDDNQNREFHVAPLFSMIPGSLFPSRRPCPSSLETAETEHAPAYVLQHLYETLLKASQEKKTEFFEVSGIQDLREANKLRELIYAALVFRSSEPPKPRAVNFVANSSIRCLT
jgi:hypothetical protein